MKSKFKTLGSYWNKSEHAAYIFLAPSFLVLVLFTVVPLLGTFVISFTNLNMFFTKQDFVGLDNFIRVFQDERAVHSLVHTIYFTLLETPAQIIVGLLFA